MIAEAKKAKIAGDIDAVFFAQIFPDGRVTKLVPLKDPEKMLAPILEGRIGPIYYAIPSEKKYRKKARARSAQMANALAFSIVDLQIYLDTLDSRQERYDKFVKRFNPAK